MAHPSDLSALSFILASSVRILCSILYNVKQYLTLLALVQFCGMKAVGLLKAL